MKFYKNQIKEKYDMFDFSLINVIAHIVYAPIVVIIHEYGHAIFVKLFGGKINYIGLGAGDKLFQYKIFRIGEIGWWYTGRICYEFENEIKTTKKILISLGGPAINIVSATLVWIVGNVEWADWYRGFIVVSYLVAIFSLIPYKYREDGLESDGLKIINLIKNSVRK